VSLFDQLAGMLGGSQEVERRAERFSRGEANLHDRNSPDFQTWNQLVGAAPPEYIHEAAAQAARRVEPNDYYDHITPGVRGTDPLGGIGRDGLGALAGALLNSFSNRHGDAGQLQQQIPGLRTTDPRQMSPQEVAALANWMRQYHPEQFGQASAQVAKQDPNLLEQLLGNKALMLAAAGLAAKFLADRSRAQRA
jgi:hypothetical protein